MQPKDRFGTSLALGDIDGDDNVDLVVDADKYDVGADTDAGRIYIFGGSASGILGTSPGHIDGSAAGLVSDTGNDWEGSDYDQWLGVAADF